MFEKKTWTDRVTEYPTRRALTKEDGTTELVTVTRDEGSVSAEGDAFSAENMNDLESRILEAISLMNMRYDVNKDVIQIYCDGKWIDWKIANLKWDGTIYNLGKEYREVGNISTLNTAAGIVASEVTKLGNAIQIGCTGSSIDYIACAYTGAKIDLTDYRTLHVLATGTTGQNGIYGEFAVSRSILSANNTRIATKAITSASQTEYVLDVSNINEECYINFYNGISTVGGYRQYTLFKAWLT